MKILRFLPIFFLFLSCSRQITSSEVVHENKQRLQWLELAKTGDAQAQFEMGNSYCCGSSGFWSTEEAIRWWCKAAAKDHAEAKEKLKRHNALRRCRQ